MTTQSIKCRLGNNSLTRTFTDTATDGTVFNGNSLLDDVASQQAGILLPGVTINSIQMTYTAGLCQWRIYDTNTQVVSRQGFASKVGYVCPMESQIAPYTLKKTDILQCFPKAVNSTAGDTEVLAWITTSGGVQSFQATTAADNTLIAMTNSITGQSLGDAFFGQN